jgi:hypothetical protein
MSSLLPASEKRKQYELRALGLRDFAGVTDDQPLDPFALAQFAKLLVVDFDQIQGLSPESREHLLGEAADEWSGGACSRPLANGWRIVILNPAHGPQRNRATLMEEISHVFLVINQTASPLSKKLEPRLAGVAGGPKIVTRDYNKSDEEARLRGGCRGVSALRCLRKSVLSGHSAEQIARRFGVSRQLVEYRIKVTRLWADYKDASTSRNQHV